MKIVDNTNKPIVVTYGALEKGEVFKHARYDHVSGTCTEVQALFIKTDRNGHAGLVSIDLETGEAYSWSHAEGGCTPVVAEVVIRG